MGYRNRVSPGTHEDGVTETGYHVGYRNWASQVNMRMWVTEIWCPQEHMRMWVTEVWYPQEHKTMWFTEIGFLRNTLMGRLQKLDVSGTYEDVAYRNWVSQEHMRMLATETGYHRNT